jgi:aldoxime dehydratase
MDTTGRHFESAIPDHLRTARTRHKRISDRFRPQHPTFATRFAPEVTEVVMAYFGVQFLGTETPAVSAALGHLQSSLSSPGGAQYWDHARYTDEIGNDTYLFVGYWDNRSTFDSWLNAPQQKSWWDSQERETDGIGYFREFFTPRAVDFETAFSAKNSEGIANLSRGMSGEIQEHGYWGSARDRIPLSQVDALEPPEPQPRSETRVIKGGRVTVTPQENLCLIRSGQDWTEADDHERKLYFNEVEPQLTTGMTFLRDQGGDLGCYTNRFVRLLDKAGQPIAKSYTMGLWRSLEDLELWAASHPTHLAIFVSAIKHFSTLGEAARLRVYHEVGVIRAQDQYFEYINCHPKTGMLNASNPA